MSDPVHIEGFHLYLHDSTGGCAGAYIRDADLYFRQDASVSYPSSPSISSSDEDDKRDEQEEQERLEQEQLRLKESCIVYIGDVKTSRYVPRESFFSLCLEVSRSL